MLRPHSVLMLTWLWPFTITVESPLWSENQPDRQGGLIDVSKQSKALLTGPHCTRFRPKILAFDEDIREPLLNLRPNRDPMLLVPLSTEQSTTTWSLELLTSLSPNHWFGRRLGLRQTTVEHLSLSRRHQLK